MRVLAIRNCPAEGFGAFGRHAAARGHEWLEVRPYLGAALPPAGEADAVLVGGTPAAAYSLEAHPDLLAEAAFLREVLAARAPCLGICFGAQLLARLLGGVVRRHSRPEIGVSEVRLTEEGRGEPVLAGFPPLVPVFQWHGDTFDVPPGGRLLATGEACRVQAFRAGSVVGVQFHLEVTAADAADWADAYAAELAAAGLSRDEVVAACAAREEEMSALAGRLLDNVLALRRVPGRRGTGA